MYCERFEPRCHFKRLSLIVRVNVINNQSIIPSSDVIQLTLTLKMTTVQVVETSVTVNINSPIQDYVHPDDQTQPIACILCSSFIHYLTSFVIAYPCV